MTTKKESKFKCLTHFDRSFNVNGVLIVTSYHRWGIVDNEGQILRSWDVTSCSRLNEFLKALLGHQESLSLDERQLKIIETIFEHTNRWKLFDDAMRILLKSGKKKALKFIEDKFTVIRLGDKLKVRG